MATACLLVPSLALASELADRPGLSGQPVALTDEARRNVLELTVEAAHRGVRAGQPLREAMALAPALAVLERRPARVAAAARALVEAMAQVTPLVEELSPGEVYGALAGVEHLYPTDAALEDAIIEAVPSILQPRLGIAETKFTAYIASRCAIPGRALRIGSDDAAQFLADKPAAWLPLPVEAIQRLRVLGIERIGGFAQLPQHAVEAQFGSPGRQAWLAANGRDPTPMRPMAHSLERVSEYTQSEPPLISREAVVRTTEQLLIRALRHPRAAHRFVRSVRIQATTDDERLWERTQVLREPMSDHGRLWTVLQTQLGLAEFPGPVARVELELCGLTTESGRQRDLFDHERIRRREQLDVMARHLKVRFGCAPLARVVEVEPWSRIPERRRALMDYDP